jgi:hypothetical protein
MLRSEKGKQAAGTKHNGTGRPLQEKRERKKINHK